MNKTLFVLIGMGILLIGCTGNPSTVVTSDVIDTDIDSNTFSPQFNSDGTITMFTFKDLQVTIFPMIDIRSRGATNRTTQEFDTLIAICTEAIKSNPQDYEAYIMLASLHINRRRQGDAELAVRYSDQALAISRDSPEALYARALAYKEKGDNANALLDLETILMTNIRSMKGVYYVMGMIYFEEGRMEEATIAFNKVKTLDPDFADINEILKYFHN